MSLSEDQWHVGLHFTHNIEPTTWAEMATDDHGEMRCDVSDGCDVSDVSTVAENGPLSIEMDAICYPSRLICYGIC